MRVRGMAGAGLAALISGMKSLFRGTSQTEPRSTGEEGDEGDGCQQLEKRVGRKLVGEDLIVFAAVAGAYLLAWAASRVFQQ